MGLRCHYCHYYCSLYPFGIAKKNSQIWDESRRPWRDSSWTSSRLWSTHWWTHSSLPTSPDLNLRKPFFACLYPPGQSSKHCKNRVWFFFTSSVTSMPSGRLYCLISWQWYWLVWLTDCLTGRPENVLLQHCVSNREVSNTGAPHETLPSHFLFTLYTMDFSYCWQFWWQWWCVCLLTSVFVVVFIAIRHSRPA